MSNPLQQAVSGAVSAIHAVAGEPVEVRRGAESAPAVSAVLTRRTYEVADAYGAVLLWESADWLIRADALLLAGRHVRPAVGDRIVRVVDGVGEEIYEVRTVPGRGHVELSDAGATQYRIHTQQVSP